jgi:hypothetical protein
MFKLFSALFALIFLVCAGLQWNDPDPYLWICLYGLAALSCVLALVNRPAKRFNLGLMAMYGVYAVYLFVTEDGVWSWMVDHQFDSLTQSMMATAPWIENTREFGGLFIMLIVCAVNVLVQRKRTDNDPDTAQAQPSI